MEIDVCQKLGILGGTGAEGRGLAMRLGQAGYRVFIGSRSEDKARKTAYELTESLRRSGLSPILEGAENAKVAAESSLIFLTIPFEAARDLLESVHSMFRQGTVIIDATIPLRFTQGRVETMELEDGSGSEHLSKFLPDSCILVAALKTISAQSLADIHVPLDCDEFVCGDSPEGKIQVIKVLSRIAGLRPVDAGSLKEARTLERMTALAIGFNRRYKVKSARFRVVGL